MDIQLINPPDPKISIIVPCYNAERWIEQCLRSALTQTYENIEVLYVDNQSTDRSMSIAQRLQLTFPQLVNLYAPNIYPNCWDEAREVGFQNMKGDYVLVIGADDFLHPKCIQSYVDVIREDPDNILALQSPIRGVQADTNICVNEITHQYSSIDEFKEQCLQKCPVNTPTVMYDTHLYYREQLKTKPEVYGGAADYDLYCSLADNGILIHPVPVWIGYYYRWHSEQATWNVHRENNNYDQKIQDFWHQKWKM